MDEKNEQHHLPVPHLSEQDARAVDSLFDDSDQPLCDEDAARLAAAKQVGEMVRTCEVEEPSTDLVAMTMQKIERSQQSISIAESSPRSFGARLGAMSFRLTELAAVAAMIAFGLCLTIVVLDRNRSDARRFACEANLAMTAVSLGQYAADHDDLMPRQQIHSGMAWYKVGQLTDGQPSSSNSANLYLLARSKYVSPDSMSCPENGEAPNVMHAAMYDWPRYEAVSYSYQNQYTNEAQRLSRDNQTAVLADKNPLFRTRGDHFVYQNQLPANTVSLAHGGAGQNIVLSDGSVTWSRKPVVQGDNIWLINGVDKYMGTESPELTGDSFLVP